MKNRRSFLAAVASSGVGFSLAARDAASAQSAPSAPPAPKPTSTGKPPSAAAAAIALSMRRFDPALTDGDLQTIARAIDANGDGAKVLSPKKKRLPNDLPPVEHFSVTGGEA